MNYLSIAAIGLAVLCLGCGEEHEGFTKTESGLWKKLNRFGDCAPAMDQCEFFIAEAHLSDLTGANPLHFVLYNGYPREKGGYSPGFGSAVSQRLLGEIRSLHCGDEVSYILPFGELAHTYLCGYEDTLFRHEQQVLFTFHLTQTFNKESWLNYLMSASQLGEISEWEAIEMSFLNDSVLSWEVHGDLFLEKRVSGTGDSIRFGRDVVMEYNTYLLDGTKVDDQTHMEFQYGKPGQLVSGLNYGLSFLSEGDHARIYMPSWLAFGEKGSSTGIIPPNTPVFFDIRVLSVRYPGQKAVQR